MPDISATELRRLQALSDRIVRSEDRRKLLQEQRNAARNEVKELKATNRQLQKDARDLTKQISEVIEENKRLAAALAAAEDDVSNVTGRAAELVTERNKLAAANDALTGETRDLTKKLSAQQKANSTLKKSLDSAQAQLEADEVPVLLTPDSVGEMLDDFVKQIDVGGLQINKGDIRLSVAFGAAGEATGFVIPSAAADKDLPLHTIALDLVRRAPLESD